MKRILIASMFFLELVIAGYGIDSETWIRHTIDNTSLGADGVRTADVNGDGLPDLVVGWEQGGISRIYIMQREESSLPTWIKVEAGPAPDVEDAFLVDLDQDGAMDVVSSTEGSNRKVLIHWAPSPPLDYTDGSLWTTETLFENGSRWMFAEVMDVDGRHGPDLVVGGKGQDASIGWLECPADPRITQEWQFHKLTAVRWTMSIIGTDINGDGLQDVLVSDRKGEKEGVFWLKNPGTQHPSLRDPWVITWIADDLHETNFIDVCDLNGDGLDEILVTHLQRDETGGLCILQSMKGKPWRKVEVKIPASIPKPKSARGGDINLDGRTDIVLSTEDAVQDRSGIIWLKQPDKWDYPDWTVHDISGPEGIKFDLNLLLDVDGDGDLDVINTEENNNAQDGNAGLGLVWFENPIIENIEL